MLPKSKGKGLPRCALLRGELSVSRLFAAGRRRAFYPLLAVWLLEAEHHVDEASCRLLVSVGKKRLRHAVDRNRTKRLVRESYRLKVGPLDDRVRALPPGPDGRPLNLRVAFVHIGQGVPDHAQVERAVGQALDHIARHL